MTGAENAAIQSAAAQILEGKNQVQAYRKLLVILQESILRGIGYALRQFREGDPGELESKVLLEFFEKKLTDSEFLSHLVRSEQPLALVRKAAFNLTVDHLRQSPPVFTAKATEGDPSGTAIPLSDVQSDGVDPEKKLRSKEETESMIRAVDGLLLKDLVLLEVVYSEKFDLPEAHIAHLAKQRGVPSDRVHDELERRGTAQAARRIEIDEEISSRWARIHSLQRQIRRVTAIIRERDGKQAEPVDELDEGLTKKFRTSSKSLANATPGQRSRYLTHLEENLRRRVQLLREAKDKLRDDLPAGPRYTEVLQILGELPPDASEQQRNTAVNTLTVRLARLRKSLRESIEEEVDGD
jgi:uncharacterized coiled-coil protein SlyX